MTLQPLGQADPYMIKAGDGRYYLYASGREGPQLYSSDHLKESWKYEGRCLDMTGQKECWTQSVIELDGKYYMYYSCLDADCEDEHGQTMRVAVSDSPSGMFKQVKKLLPPFSIDAHAVKTPSGLYLFYCNNDYEAERAGTFIQCDKLADPYTLERKPVAVVRPTIDEEIYQKDRFKKRTALAYDRGRVLFLQRRHALSDVFRRMLSESDIFYRLQHRTWTGGCRPAHTSVDEISGRSYVCAAFVQNKRDRRYGA